MKPDNFLVGFGPKASVVHIIDFGLVKPFTLPSGEHVPCKFGKSLTGTARYVSINTHAGCEQSRRDDLEGMMYVLLYFLRRGTLPWQSQVAKTKTEKYKKIMDIKKGTSPDELCKGLPGTVSKNNCRGAQTYAEVRPRAQVRGHAELFRAA